MFWTLHDIAIEKYTTPVFTNWKNMTLDQVSASYMAPGSGRTHFRVSATKQTTTIDSAIQKRTKSICRASPETHFSRVSSSNSNNLNNFFTENPRIQGAV